VTERAHGYARYRLDGCRCNTCGWERYQYDRNRTRAIAYGTWQPFVDAEPVRVHVRSLQSCSMGLRVIADRAGINRKTLQAVLNGRPERGTPPQEKMRAAVAAAVLAVEPTLESLAPSTLISPLGTRRRIQALVAVGWPQQYLAEHLGMQPGNFGQMLGRDQVLVRRALDARAMYETLWRTDPAEHGATAAGISRARKYAAARSWAPPAAWDDERLDDPEAFPDWTGQCGTPLGDGAHRHHGLLPVCQPCKDARNAHDRERRARKAVVRSSAGVPA
jgi:transcriptional regulator with XRE-family HTH domain